MTIVEARKGPVLRTINHPNRAAAVTLKVKGSIVSDWVLFLEIQLRSLLQRARGVLVDLSEVKEVDARGVEMLKRMTRQQLRLINCPSIVQERVGSSGCL